VTSSRRSILVTVRAPRGETDLAVAADLPVFQLLPALIAATGGEAAMSSVDSARWQLLGEDGRLLAPRSTLAASDVVDGERLQILSTKTTGAQV
jgi:hypothetical protein